MDKIPFSKNWNNKLNSEYFTSIRLPNRKYTPGNILEVHCSNEWRYNAMVLHSKEILLYKLTEYDTLIDAGMCRVDFIYMMKKMYPEYNFEEKPMVMLLFKQMPVDAATAQAKTEFIPMIKYPAVMQELQSRQKALF